MANSWGKYEKLVLHELSENSKNLSDLMRSVVGLREDVAGLKVKAAIAGGMAGLVGTGILTAVVSIWK